MYVRLWLNTVVFAARSEGVASEFFRRGAGFNMATEPRRAHHAKANILNPRFLNPRHPNHKNRNVNSKQSERV